MPHSQTQEHTQQLPGNHPSLRAGRLVPNNRESNQAQRRAAAAGDLEAWFQALRERNEDAWEMMRNRQRFEDRYLRMCNYLPRGEDQTLLIDYFCENICRFLDEAFSIPEDARWDISVCNEDGIQLASLEQVEACEPMNIALDALLNYHSQNDEDDWLAPGVTAVENSIILSEMSDEPLLLTIYHDDRTARVELGLWVSGGSYMYQLAHVEVVASDFISLSAHRRLQSLVTVAARAAECEQLLHEMALAVEREMAELGYDEGVDLDIAAEDAGWGEALRNEIFRNYLRYTMPRER